MVNGERMRELEGMWLNVQGLFCTIHVVLRIIVMPSHRENIDSNNGVIYSINNTVFLVQLP